MNREIHSSRSSSSTTSSSDDARLGSQANGPQLSAPHHAALHKLKHLCQTRNVYWHTNGAGGRTGSYSNDEATLLRYLRARKYVPQAAFEQYSATVAWRRKLQLDELYRTAEVSHFEAIRRLMPQWTGRRSRNGVPIFVYSVSRTRPEDLLVSSQKDPSLSSVFLAAEYSANFVLPLCASMHVDRVMPCSIFIIDLTGVSVSHFWNMRALLQKASTMATSHYPECVDKIFIVGAPSFFPAVWGYINKWFEPNLTSKIFVLTASEMKTTLNRHIDMEDLPVPYGGNLVWEYGMYPDLDDEARRNVGKLANDWIDGPLHYFCEGDGDEIIAAGTKGGIIRNTVLAKLPVSRAGSQTLSDSEEDCV